MYGRREIAVSDLYHAGEPNEYYGRDYKRDYKIASNYKEVLTSVSKM